MTILGHLEQHPGIDPPDFTATVTDVSDESIEVDRTCFYPMGGGQPADRGTVTKSGFECHVTNVIKKDTVTHHIDDVEGVLNVGDEIECSIDRIWRNQLSTMHTAQHLMSALAHEEWAADTVGNQIGNERTRIDLKFEDRDAFDAGHLQEMVNDAIQRDHTVHMDFRPSKELMDDPLVRVNMERMPPNIDVCPCAGTHVPNTGMISPVRISRVKSKGAGRLRVEYVFE